MRSMVVGQRRRWTIDCRALRLILTRPRRPSDPAPPGHLPVNGED
jgi:hypothetical protein